MSMKRWSVTVKRASRSLTTGPVRLRGAAALHVLANQHFQDTRITAGIPDGNVGPVTTVPSG